MRVEKALRTLQRHPEQFRAALDQFLLGCEPDFLIKVADQVQHHIDRLAHWTTAKRDQIPVKDLEDGHVWNIARRLSCGGQRRRHMLQWQSNKDIKEGEWPLVILRECKLRGLEPLVEYPYFVARNKLFNNRQKAVS